MNIKNKLKKIENSRQNTLYVVIEYTGGDADGEYIREHKLETSFNDSENLSENDIEFIQLIKNVKNILNYDSISSNNIDCDTPEGKFIDYNVPRDATCDYQFYCYIQFISIIGYDNECNKYKFNI